MTRPLDEAEGPICIGCGLCCDGTLLATALVRPDDAEFVSAAGLEIAEEGQKRYFRLPCPHFSCGSCQIYAKRPKVCRKYRCALLTNLEAGEISRTDALEKIAMAQMLVAAVRRLAPTAVTAAERPALKQRLKAELRELDDRLRQPAAKTLLAIGVLEHFLNRWFYKMKNEAAEPETK